MAPDKPTPSLLTHVVLALLLFAVACQPDSTLVLPTLAPTYPAPTQVVDTATREPTPIPPTPTDEPTPNSPTLAPTPVLPTLLPVLPSEPPASATPAPTPTDTPTPTPTPRPTATAFAMKEPVLYGVTPTLSDTTAVPTPVPRAAVPLDAINIIVLGSDRREDWDHWNTDVIQVVSIQPMLPSVTVLSIPRDLYVYIPGFRMGRVNVADMYGEVYGYPGGGPALVQQTLLYNLGIPVDHYVRTDFDGFIGIVNALGGIDVPVHCRLSDYWPYPDENGEFQIKAVYPGWQHFDGHVALWYARSRKTSSVFDRERRQQQVLEAIYRQSMSVNVVPRIPELWEQSRSMIVTDMELTDVARLAEIALRLRRENIRFRNIGYGQVVPWTTPGGGNVFLPNWSEIAPVVQEAMLPVPEGRLWRSLQTVEVWDGTPYGNWDRLPEDRLLREGFVVTIGTPDRRDYAQTRLIDFTTTSKGSATSYLQWMLNIAPDQVISAPDPNMPVHYRLIVGTDFETCRKP